MNAENIALATCNYAREPEFARDRMNLRKINEEVDSLRRRITSRHIKPMLGKLKTSHDKLCSDVRKLEEDSEKMANDMLTGNKPFNDFVDDYTPIRKRINSRRMLTDRLAKEYGKLDQLESMFEKDLSLQSPSKVLSDSSRTSSIGTARRSSSSRASPKPSNDSLLENALQLADRLSWPPEPRTHKSPKSRSNQVELPIVPTRRKNRSSQGGVRFADQLYPCLNDQHERKGNADNTCNGPLSSTPKKL